MPVTDHLAPREPPLLHQQMSSLRAAGVGLATRLAALATERAATQEAVARTLERSAMLRPHSAPRLRSLAQEARRVADQERDHADRWGRYVEAEKHDRSQPRG